MPVLLLLPEPNWEPWAAQQLLNKKEGWCAAESLAGGSFILMSSAFHNLSIKNNFVGFPISLLVPHPSPLWLLLGAARLRAGPSGTCNKQNSASPALLGGTALPLVAPSKDSYTLTIAASFESGAGTPTVFQTTAGLVRPGTCFVITDLPEQSTKINTLHSTLSQNTKKLCIKLSTCCYLKQSIFFLFSLWLLIFLLSYSVKIFNYIFFIWSQHIAENSQIALSVKLLTVHLDFC